MQTPIKIMLTRTAFAVLGTSGLLPAGAQQIVTNRAAQNATATADWATLGPNNTSVTNPFVFATAGGPTLTISKTNAGNPFNERRQSGPNTGPFWYGNFAPGDGVLWMNEFNNSNPGPMSITFSSPVSGAGAQIQWNAPGTGTAFAAQIQAFDPQGNSLGTFTEGGNSTAANDNSAIYLGVQSATADIARIQFEVDPGAGTSADFAINRLSIAAAPEPSQCAALGLGVLGLAGLTVRARRRRTA